LFKLTGKRLTKSIVGLVSDWAGHHASGECDGNKRSGEFSEHDDYVFERMCSDWGICVSLKTGEGVDRYYLRQESKADPKNTNEV
jgi:hypothetical protein